MPKNHAELIANLPKDPDVIAPDGPEIHLMESLLDGSRTSASKNNYSCGPSSDG
jgi:hypothetical protein